MEDNEIKGDEIEEKEIKDKEIEDEEIEGGEEEISEEEKLDLNSSDDDEDRCFRRGPDDFTIDEENWVLRTLHVRGEICFQSWKNIDGLLHVFTIYDRLDKGFLLETMNINTQKMWRLKIRKKEFENLFRFIAELMNPNYRDKRFLYIIDHAGVRPVPPGKKPRPILFWMDDDPDYELFLDIEPVRDDPDIAPVKAIVDEKIDLPIFPMPTRSIAEAKKIRERMRQIRLTREKNCEIIISARKQEFLNYVAKLRKDHREKEADRKEKVDLDKEDLLKETREAVGAMEAAQRVQEELELKREENIKLHEKKQEDILKQRSLEMLKRKKELIQKDRDYIERHKKIIHDRRVRLEEEKRDREEYLRETEKRRNKNIETKMEKRREREIYVELTRKEEYQKVQERKKTMLREERAAALMETNSRRKNLYDRIVRKSAEEREKLKIDVENSRVHFYEKQKETEGKPPEPELTANELLNKKREESISKREREWVEHWANYYRDLKEKAAETEQKNRQLIRRVMKEEADKKEAQNLGKRENDLKNEILNKKREMMIKQKRKKRYERILNEIHSGSFDWTEINETIKEQEDQVDRYKEKWKAWRQQPFLLEQDPDSEESE